MTTPTQPRPAATAGPGQPQPGRTDGALTAAGRASRALTGRGSGTTPRRLRLARLVLVLLTLAVGVGAVATGTELDDREATAAQHATQLERASSVEASLRYAQENAAEKPAAGAVLPEKTRNALDTATTTLIELAGEGTDDSASLAEIGRLISHYTEALAAGQSAQAKQVLENDLLPAVQQLQAEHTAVASTQLAWWMWLVPVGAWLAVATIVGVSWYTARVSRRLVNPGLALAAVATAALAVRSGNVLAAQAAGSAADAGFVVLAVATTAISAAAAAWGLHQRLKEYK